jgi:hypothetical protein
MSHEMRQRTRYDLRGYRFPEDKCDCGMCERNPAFMEILVRLGADLLVFKLGLN